MATIIDFDAARARREARRAAAEPAVFTFDLASPHARHAAAAAAERTPDAEWHPAYVRRGDHPHGLMAARVAAAAADAGHGRAFAEAALRLLWDQREDLEDIGTLARAAGSVGLPLNTVLDAAFDPRRDAELEQRAAQTSSMKTISVESDLRGPSLRMRV